MAHNEPALYGRDIACVADADDLFTDVTGLEVVAQDALHAITSQSFLGPNGDGRGIDVRDLIGSRQKDLTAQQPIIAEVLERDDRIARAEVLLTETQTNGLLDARLQITCFTALGPFSFTKNVSELTTTIALEGESAT